MKKEATLYTGEKAGQGWEGAGILAHSLKRSRRSGISWVWPDTGHPGKAGESPGLGFHPPEGQSIE